MRSADIAAALLRELDMIDDSGVASDEGRRFDGEVMIPVEGQSFDNFDSWADTASAVLTAHEDYNDTEHGPYGYRGRHFKALCFDQFGRRCAIGKDFMRAKDGGAFPVWYIWPDQIAVLLREVMK